MAISFQLVTHHSWHTDSDVVNVAYTVILASVVFHDFFAPRILRSLLVDAGELRREQEA
jgi:NhaP-type Na+/H+ or K+/H+ antiporter